MHDQLRQYLIAALMAEPFRRFFLILNNGLEVSVSHPEAIAVRPELEVIVVQDATDSAIVFHSESIIGIKRASGFA
jgi:hypothetical protein